jgi:hypothetical protein
MSRLGKGMWAQCRGKFAADPKPFARNDFFGTTQVAMRAFRRPEPVCAAISGPSKGQIAQACAT